MYSFVKYVPMCDLTRSGLLDNRTIKFAPAEFPFRQQVTRALVEQGMLARLEELEQLHKCVPLEDQRLDETLQNAIAIRFYDTPPAILKTYRRFIKFIARELGTDLVYQAQPTFRFYFAGHPGHERRMLIHSDIMLGHPPQEINVWLPLTQCFDTNSLAFANLTDSLQILRHFNYDFTRFEPNSPAVEEQLKGKLSYFEGDFGDCLLFDARSLHGTPINDTGSTRVSMDFRVMPLSEYEAIDYPYRGTGRRRARFTRGDYYAAGTVSGGAK